MKHGDERTRNVAVNNGKTNFLRKEKYCARHEVWVDITIGGKAEWTRLHGNCEQTSEHGAFVMPPRAMGKAA